MVDVSQHVIIHDVDCAQEGKPIPGMYVKAFMDGKEEIESLQAVSYTHLTSQGEMALGKNPLIGFMTWEGYNYEDAVLLSERLVQDDVYTSIPVSYTHLDVYKRQVYMWMMPNYRQVCLRHWRLTRK